MVSASWFCVQCVSRLGQRLPISLLELNTFGHALCTLLIYFMWWNKPLDIEEPEVIPVQGADMEQLAAAMCVASKVEIDPQTPSVKPLAEIDPQGTPEQEVGTLTFAVEWNPILQEGGFAKAGVDSLSNNPDICHFTIVEEATPEINLPIGPGPYTFRPGELLNGVVFRNASRDPEVHDPRPISRPVVEVAHLDLLRWKLAVRVHERPPRSSVAVRIRNFPRLDEPLEQWPLYLAFGIIGLAYGGLHCLAWNAPFPTDLERLFWRVSSVTITSTAALIALGFIWTISPPFWVDLKKVFKVAWEIYEASTDCVDTSFIEVNFICCICCCPPVWGFLAMLIFSPLKLLFDVAVAAFIIFYILARTYLVVECFINVAHLPDGAYQMPQWSQYVPHIG
ncbi:hypothetical protein IMZ48_39510 [Candidatus Bathyarchaeota archaeon]|nr:hypothetical protein [Candidatus Bathyarchaeota archaeon]